MIHVHSPPPALAEPEPVRTALENPALRGKMLVNVQVLLRRWMSHASGVARNQAAEDVVSEAMTLALSKSSHYDPARANVTSWILGFAQNIARKQFTRAKARGDVHCLAVVVDPSVPVQDALIQKAEHEQLHGALAQLSPVDQQIAQSFYFEKMSGAEIATSIGISAVHVRVKLVRIRSELFHLLSPTFTGDQS